MDGVSDGVGTIDRVGDNWTVRVCVVDIDIVSDAVRVADADEEAEALRETVFDKVMMRDFDFDGLTDSEGVTDGVATLERVGVRGTVRVSVAETDTVVVAV